MTQRLRLLPLLLLLAQPGCTAEGLTIPLYDLADGSVPRDAKISHAITVERQGDGNGQIVSDPSGIACGTTCSATFSGGTVALTASPADGSELVGWSGACTGVGVCTISLDESSSVPQLAIATFALRRGKVLVTRTGDGSGTVTGAGIDCGTDCETEPPLGAVLQLTATPDPGSVFTGWTSCIASGETCDVLVPTVDAVGVSARFSTCPVPTPGAVRYVDPVLGHDGIEFGGGTGLCAYRTIQYALLHAEHEIRLGPGHYEPTTADPPPYVLTGDQALIGDASDPSAVVFEGKPGSDFVGIVIFAGQHNELMHCTIEGPGGMGLLALELTSPPADITKPHLVQHNVFHGLSGHIYGHVGGVRIVDNIFQETPNNAIQWNSSGMNPPSELSSNQFISNSTDIVCPWGGDTALTGSGNRAGGGAIECYGCAGCPFY